MEADAPREARGWSGQRDASRKRPHHKMVRPFLAKRLAQIRTKKRKNA
jgi:hypothetical protein